MRLFASYILTFLLFALFSCSQPDTADQLVSLPSDSIIPEKTMIALLVDVHLLEGGMMVQRNKGQQDLQWGGEAYRKLFLRYHVKKNQFIKNMVYYQGNPKNYSRMYDTVLARIDKLRPQSKDKKQDSDKGK